MTPVPARPDMPDESLDQFNRFSIEDFIAFWTYAFKKRRISLVLYPAISLALLLGYYQVVQHLAGNVLSVDALIVSVLTVGLFALFFIYLPSMPGEYMHRFKETLRQDVSGDEIRRLFMDSIAKSLEQASIILTVILLVCVSIYWAAKSLALPDFWAWVLVIGAGINIYLVSLVLISMGKYNREHLGKTFVEKEYKRYTSFGNYKKLLAILGIADILGIVVIVILFLSP